MDQTDNNTFIRKISHTTKRRNFIGNLFVGPIIAIIAMCIVHFNDVVIHPVIIEHRDVIVNETYKEIERTDKTVKLEVSAVKQLDCYFVPDSQQGFMQINNNWYETTFEFYEDKSDNTTRPVNTSDTVTNFGVWKWESLMLKKATEVKTTVKHICNQEMEDIVLNGEHSVIVKGKQRTTTIGPFKISIN